MRTENNFTIGEVRAFWDGVADSYDGINMKIGSSHYQRFIESVKYLRLNGGDKLLNIWSRTGNAIPRLRQIGATDIYNLEVSPAMLRLAEQKYPGENFRLTDLESLDFSDNFFDAILSLETLEHAPKPLGFLQELYRVLKPGKILVMSLPPKTAELSLKIYEMFFHNHGEGPHRFLPPREVKELLKAAGFELILHKGTLLIPAGPGWLQRLGERIIEWFQNTPIRELGIRQFYVCKKPE